MVISSESHPQSHEPTPLTSGHVSCGEAILKGEDPCNDCDTETVLAARRKRYEIRRFKVLARQSSSFIDSPPKRARTVQAAVLCDVEACDEGELLETLAKDVDETRAKDVAATVHLQLSSSFSTEVVDRDEGSSTKAGLDASAAATRKENSLGVLKGVAVDITCKVTVDETPKISHEKMVPLLMDMEEQRRRRRLRWRRHAKTAAMTESCPSHCVVSICGRSRGMEDAAVAVPSFLRLSPHLPDVLVDDAPRVTRELDVKAFHFFGVYDGHGGPQVADFCKERLHGALAAEVSSRSGDLNQSEDQWKASFTSCFKQLDEELCGFCPLGGAPACPTCHKNAAGSSSSCREPLVSGAVGSTAVVAVVGATSIIVANCGDSRAVLCRGGRPLPLSSDHKANRPDEMARIEAAGGRVFPWEGYRVLGVLAMSRALGDRYLKPYVIAEPEITFTQRNVEDECLILASDGLWDVLSNEEVCDVARKCMAARRNKHSSHAPELIRHRDNDIDSPAQAAAALLTKLALARNSKDNISVVVVDLKY